MKKKKSGHKTGDMGKSSLSNGHIVPNGETTAHHHHTKQKQATDPILVNGAEAIQDDNNEKQGSDKQSDHHKPEPHLSSPCPSDLVITGSKVDIVEQLAKDVSHALDLESGGGSAKENSSSQTQPVRPGPGVLPTSQSISSSTSSGAVAKSQLPSSFGVDYAVYQNELQMPDIMRLIQKDLSEPYSIYTYRYFIHNWPHLCFMARVKDECVGAIVCKLDYHKKVVKRGYIAMLAVDSEHRKRKIGSTLVKRDIDAMVAEDADEVVLETEITNKPALRLYENLGFVRDKRLFRYYLNGVDALRLKLWLR